MGALGAHEVAIGWNGQELRRETLSGFSPRELIVPMPAVDLAPREGGRPVPLRIELTTRALRPRSPLEARWQRPGYTISLWSVTMRSED